MSLRATLAVAVIACSAFGCRKAGDSTWAGEPVVNRDTTWTAAGIEFQHNLPMIGIESDPAPASRNFEIHTYDLVHRTGPRRIVRWSLDREESPWIVGWDDTGLIVARTRVGPAVRVDPVTGATKAMGPVGSLEDWSSRLNSRDLHRTHVEHRSEGYFLWSPRSREWEFLFPTPVEMGKQPDAYTAEAARERYADTLHRIWQLSARHEGGRTLVSVETYVPRPGKTSRLYMLSAYVEIPDTTGEHFFDDRFVPLATQEVVLASAATTLQFPVSNQELHRSMAPYRLWFRREVSRGTIPVRVRIQLQPMMLPGDQDKLPTGFRVASREDLDFAIPVPRAWTADALESIARTAECPCPGNGRDPDRSSPRARKEGG